jgi:hypothetical protein
MQQPRMTRHARQRLQQRGGRTKEVAIVMTYADIEVPAKNGCRFLRLSHQEAARLLQQNETAFRDVDRARRLAVLADPSDRVVTVLKCDPERRLARPQSRAGGRR